MNLITRFKVWTNEILAKVGLELRRINGEEGAQHMCQATLDLEFLRSLTDDGETLSKVLPLLNQSRSQLRQDLFALIALSFKPEGYFVEVGACDGVSMSNTHLLEKEFGWTGILAEPGRNWHDALVGSRFCSIDTRCVWSRSGESLQFFEATNPKLSTAKSLIRNDLHRFARRKRSAYSVKTVSLVDLLKQYSAPSEIDFLSIDTEGAEFEILSGFDFSAYTFKVIVCEHNFTESRGRIHSLLTENGYRRVLEHVSLVDDWYLHSSLPDGALLEHFR